MCRCYFYFLCAVLYTFTRMVKTKIFSNATTMTFIQKSIFILFIAPLCRKLTILEKSVLKNEKKKYTKWQFHLFTCCILDNQCCVVLAEGEYNLSLNPHNCNYYVNAQTPIDHFIKSFCSNPLFRVTIRVAKIQSFKQSVCPLNYYYRYRFYGQVS